MKLGYLRVSTEEQNPDRQIDALKSICDELYIEKFSAKTQNRPIFKSVLSKLRKGDTLVVLSIDRAFRSTVDAINQADRLRSLGIEFQIVNMAMDTSTADGKLAYTIMAAVAQHESDRISERTKQGIRAARKRGAILGRPRKLSAADVRSIEIKLDMGETSLSEIANEFGVHPRSIQRAVLRNKKLHQPSELT